MAPSRYKKVMRDSKVTQAFFNQGKSNDHSEHSAICSCCRDHLHSHKLNPGDIDISKLAETAQGEDSLKCLVIET